MIAEATLEIFQREGQTVRVSGTPEKPMFAATDVCKCLGIGNPTKALYALQDDEKMTVISSKGNPRNGQPHSLAFITESGLYTLIIRCRAAVNPGTPAYRFRRWVTSEILPAIRRKSMAGAPPVSSAPPSRIELAQMVIDIEREKLRLEHENARLLPAAQFGTDLMDSDSLFTFTQVAKSLGTTAISLARFLHDQRVIFRQPNGEWVPYAKYDGQGYFRIVAHTYDTGTETRVSHTLKILPAGRAFVHELWRSHH